jgi:hypothetical protein
MWMILFLVAKSTILSVKNMVAVTILEILAYASLFCNRHKGTDIGSIHPETTKLTRFYNPRKDHWSKHFRLNGVIIDPLTGIGKVTVRLFAFNKQERLLERETLISIGTY